MDQYHGRDHKIPGKIQRNLSKNETYIKELLENCDDVIFHEFHIGSRRDIGIFVVYTDGLVNSEMIQESVIKPMIIEDIKDVYDSLDHWILETADRKWVNTMEDAVTAILSGNTIVFVEGLERAIYISTKMFPTRGVQEAAQEVTLVGPKDSFNESLRTNTALIRRRIRDTRLKVLQRQVGTRSKTDYAIMYISDLVKPDMLKKVEEQLKNISIDGMLDAGMLEQFLEKSKKTVFPMYQLTQRPDKTASGIMEGRIAIVVDNSPMALLLPATLDVFFQASDDYYHRWEIASFARLLRYVAAFLAIGLPGFYVAISSFHPEILPTSFLLALVSARQGVPFPIVVEVILMELAFELLREAGIRLPGQLSGTIGVVGGLIVGQAAVDAHLVSTIVVIVVALTAIATFAIPNEVFTGAFRLLKFFLIIMCALWGLYGFFLGFLGVLIHLFRLENYGVPYLYPTVGKEGRGSVAFQDYVIRKPWENLVRRPEFTRQDARVRQKEEHRGK